MDDKDELEKRPKKPTAMNLSDTFAADLTARLTSLSTSLRYQVDASSHNVASMERSVASVRSLTSKYSDFANVSQESRRLVRRHGEKRRRDVKVMKGAVAVFLVVCLYVFLRRLPLIGFLLRTLYKAVIRNGQDEL